RRAADCSDATDEIVPEPALAKVPSANRRTAGYPQKGAAGRCRFTCNSRPSPALPGGQPQSVPALIQIAPDTQRELFHHEVFCSNRARAGADFDTVVARAEREVHLRSLLAAAAIAA